MDLPWDWYIYIDILAYTKLRVNVGKRTIHNWIPYGSLEMAPPVDLPAAPALRSWRIILWTRWWRPFLEMGCSFFFSEKKRALEIRKKKRNPRFHMEESVGKKSHIKTFQLCLEGSMITLTDLDLFFCVIFVHGLGSHGMNPPPFFTSIWNIFVGTFFPSIKQQANPRSTLGVMIFWKKWGGSTSI